MAYAFLADLTVFLHFAFIVFVIGGGVLVRWWPKLVWAHLTAAAWGAYVSLANRICPLTPLENALRTRAGLQGYEGGFVEHYVLPVLYPAGLTRPMQATLGSLVLVVNLIAYGVLVRRLLRGG